MRIPAVFDNHTNQSIFYLWNLSFFTTLRAIKFPCCLPFSQDSV